MPRRAWYIGCSEDDVGEAAILVGDRARIDRIADHLDPPIFLPENRGLRTVTGLRAGKRVTATAFGMGGADRGDRAARTLRSRRAEFPADRHGDGDASGRASETSWSPTARFAARERRAPTRRPDIPPSRISTSASRCAHRSRGAAADGGPVCSGPMTASTPRCSPSPPTTKHGGGDARRGSPSRPDCDRHGDRDGPDRRPNARRARRKPLHRHGRRPHPGEDRRVRTCRTRERVVRDRARRDCRPAST